VYTYIIFDWFVWFYLQKYVWYRMKNIQIMQRCYIYNLVNNTINNSLAVKNRNISSCLFTFSNVSFQEDKHGSWWTVLLKYRRCVEYPPLPHPILNQKINKFLFLCIIIAFRNNNKIHYLKQSLKYAIRVFITRRQCSFSS
jgi:hypothetical protein